MAEQLSLHTQITAIINGQETQVDIIATSPQELLDSVAALTGKAAAPTQSAPEAKAQPSPQPQPAAQPAPGPTAGSAASPTSQAAPAPAATPSPEPAAAEVTLNDVLAPARQLLQLPNGEDTLRNILGQFGAQAISQADPQHYAGIKQAIEQHIGQA